MAISSKKQRVQVTLDKQTIEKLEEHSQVSPFRKSDIIELALMEYFKQHALQSS